MVYDGEGGLLAGAVSEAVDGVAAVGPGVGGPEVGDEEIPGRQQSISVGWKNKKRTCK